MPKRRGALAGASIALDARRDRADLALADDAASAWPRTDLRGLAMRTEGACRVDSGALCQPGRRSAAVAGSGSTGGASAGRTVVPSKKRSSSTGMGKTNVELFSAATSVIVDSSGICIAPGLSSSVRAASPSDAAASSLRGRE